MFVCLKSLGHPRNYRQREKARATYSNEQLLLEQRGRDWDLELLLCCLSSWWSTKSLYPSYIISTTALLTFRIISHWHFDSSFDLHLHPLYTSESGSSLQASSISCSLFTKRCWERINQLLQRSEFVDRCNFNTCNASTFRVVGIKCTLGSKVLKEQLIRIILRPGF